MDEATRPDEAVKVLADIYGAFGLGAVVNPEASALLPLIRDGRLVFDPATDRIEYRLAAPVQLLNKDTLSVVSFRELSGSEVEYVRSNLESNGTNVRLGPFADATMRVLIKTGPLQTGVVERFKARDLDTLQGVFAELGFFGR